MFFSYESEDGNFTDLACERRRADESLLGVEFKKKRAGDFVWERMRITDAMGERSVGRPIGRYDTLTLKRADTLDSDGIFDAAEEVAKELCFMCESSRVVPSRILAVGLGNADLTPDSLGPKCVSKINATMHLGSARPHDCSEIAVFAPSVEASSGIESFECVIAICDRILPDAVFVIDALTARSPERLGTTVQFSDTGICPGSGVARARRELSRSTLGVPVISIGMPTVISSGAFCREDKAKDLSRMLVAPREIDAIVNKAADIISLGINQAFGLI